MGNLGVRVLLAEDDELIRLMLAELLDEAGYDIMEARSGTEALNIINALHSIDILLSDVNMPGSDGVEVARHLRGFHPGVPVILVSGRVDLLWRRKLDQPFLCIPKPFSTQTILTAVHELLSLESRGRLH